MKYSGNWKWALCIGNIPSLLICFLLFFFASIVALEQGARQYGCELGWAGIGCNICEKEVYFSDPTSVDESNPIVATYATIPGYFPSSIPDSGEFQSFPGLCAASNQVEVEECVKNFVEGKYLNGACDVETRGLANWLGGKAVTEFQLRDGRHSSGSGGDNNGNNFVDPEKDVEMFFTVYSVEEEKEDGDEGVDIAVGDASYFYYRAAFSCLASSCRRGKVEEKGSDYDYIYNCDAITCQTDCEVGGIRTWCIPLLDQIVGDINGAISLLCTADGSKCNLQQEILNTYFREGLNYQDCDWGKCMVNEGKIVDSIGTLTNYGKDDASAIVYQKINYVFALLTLFCIFFFLIVSVAGYFYWEHKIIAESRKQIYSINEDMFESHFTYQNYTADFTKVIANDMENCSHTKGANESNTEGASGKEIKTQVKSVHDHNYITSTSTPFPSFSFSLASSSNKETNQDKNHGNNNATTNNNNIGETDYVGVEIEEQKKFTAKRNCITFRNISYSIEKHKSFMDKGLLRKASRTEAKTILRNIEGNIMEGDIMAILGPSGSGKSTFLEILALKNKQGRINGNLQIYDSQVNFPDTSLRSASFPSIKALKSRIAFVDQANFLFPTSTVLEALLFSAFLRLPRSLQRKEKQERVKEVIKQLGLENILDSQIGSDSIRGLSGGEKRKLSCGIELLSRPLILLLDEPTSGLDSHNAKSLVNMLTNLVQPSTTFSPALFKSEEENERNDKNLTVKTSKEINNCTEDKSKSQMMESKNQQEIIVDNKEKTRISVVMTIHQPRREVFDCFSRLLVLEKGQVVYHGSPKNLTKYLASIHLFLPPQCNLADFLLDILFQPPLEKTQQKHQKKINSSPTRPKQSRAKRDVILKDNGYSGKSATNCKTGKKEIELIPQNQDVNYFPVVAHEKGADVGKSQDDYENRAEEVADTKIIVDETDDISYQTGHKRKGSSILEIFHNFALPPVTDLNSKNIIQASEFHNNVEKRKDSPLKVDEGKHDTLTYKNTSPMNSKMALSWSSSVYAKEITKEVADIFFIFDRRVGGIDTNFECSSYSSEFSLKSSTKNKNDYLKNDLHQNLPARVNEKTAHFYFFYRALKNIQYSFLEYFIISQRLVRDNIRKPIIMLAHNSASFYIALLLGLFYFNLPLVGLPAVQNRMGVFMLEMLFFAITSISALPLFWVDKDLYKFEKSNGFYSTGPYFTAKVAMDFIPNRLIPSWIVVMITQYMIGFSSEENTGNSSNPFFTYLVGLSLIAIISSSFNFLIGMLTSNIMTGLLTSSFLLLHFLLLTGIFNNFEKMEIQWLKIFPYISFFNYGYDMLVSNELQGREVEDIPVNIDAVLIELGFHPSRINIYLFILFCYFLVIITVAYFVLKYRVKEKR